MQIHKIYDNGGKTIDRYTILTEPYYFGKSCMALGVDSVGGRGFSQWGEAFDGPHLGKEITFEDLPEETQAHVIERLKDD
jgi:hypothetical protein